MNYLAAIKNSLVLVGIVLINSIGFAGHTSAMSTMSHEMTGMNHQSSDATSCASLCRMAVLNSETTNPKQLEDDQDDDIQLCPYLNRGKCGNYPAALLSSVFMPAK